MMYYIDTINTWKAPNRKCSEIQEFVRQYENCLVKDDLSKDALVEDIQHKVDELNAAYPRTGKVVVTMSHGEHVRCAAGTTSFDDKYVFTFRFCPVRKNYRFNEQTALLDEVGGEAEVDARENVIQNITNLLRVSPFTVDFEVKKNPKGIRIINEVTQEHLNEIMEKAREGGDR